MKKRLITVFTAAVLILSLFAGACGKKELTAVRVGSLKGPTTMGIVNMMSEAEAGTTAGKYEFTMETDPSVLAAGMINGNYDIVMVPANMAAILYNKTEGGVKVLDINTGGVLEVLSGRDDIDEIEDLAGQKVVLTGQGATPEYALRYLLDQYGIEDAKLEFHPEATEVAAVLAEDPQQIAVLPEPFATVCQKSNENVRSVFTLSDAWAGLGDDVNGGSRLLTGVTVVNAAFAESNKEELKAFMNDHEASAAKAASDVDGTAALVASYGIIEKEPVAKAALPYCAISCVEGTDMKTQLSGYLKVLFDADPASVGGTLPGEDFYFINE